MNKITLQDAIMRDGATAKTLGRQLLIATVKMAYSGTLVNVHDEHLEIEHAVMVTYGGKSADSYEETFKPHLGSIQIRLDAIEAWMIGAKL